MFAACFSPATEFTLLHLHLLSSKHLEYPASSSVIPFYPVFPTTTFADVVPRRADASHTSTRQLSRSKLHRRDFTGKHREKNHTIPTPRHCRSSYQFHDIRKSSPKFLPFQPSAPLVARRSQPPALPPKICPSRRQGGAHCSGDSATNQPGTRLLPAPKTPSSHPSAVPLSSIRHACWRASFSSISALNSFN